MNWYSLWIEHAGHLDLLSYDNLKRSRLLTMVFIIDSQPLSRMLYDYNYKGFKCFSNEDRTKCRHFSMKYLEKELRVILWSRTSLIDQWIRRWEARKTYAVHIGNGDNISRHTLGICCSWRPSGHTSSTGTRHPVYRLDSESGTRTLASGPSSPPSSSPMLSPNFCAHCLGKYSRHGGARGRGADGDLLRQPVLIVTPEIYHDRCCRVLAQKGHLNEWCHHRRSWRCCILRCRRQAVLPTKSLWRTFDSSPWVLIYLAHQKDTLPQCLSRRRRKEGNASEVVSEGVTPEAEQAARLFRTER